MKDKNWQYISYIFVIAFIATILITAPRTMTGGSHISIYEEKPSTYAYKLKDWVYNFFQIENAVFPTGTCADITKEFLTEFLEKGPSVTEKFTTTGSQRVQSLLFGIEQEFVGAIEMIHGKNLVDREDSDSILNLWVEGVVRLPKLSRASELEVTIYGEASDHFYVKSGKFSTPMLECNFFALPNGASECKCETGRTYEYVNE